MVSLDCLDLMTPCIPPIAVHLECDVLGDWTLAQGADKQLSKLLHGPFCRWRSESPAPEVRQVKIGHGGVNVYAYPNMDETNDPAGEGHVVCRRWCQGRRTLKREVGSELTWRREGRERRGY